MPKATLVLLSALAGCVYTVHIENESIDIDEPFSAVVVDNDVGDVTISGGQDDASLDVSYRYHNRKPELTWRVDDGTLYIEGTCPTVRLTCGIDLELNTPTNVDVTVSVDTGSLMLRDLDGSFVGAMTTGSVDLHGLRGQAEIDTTTGGLVGVDLALSTLEIELTTGGVDAAYTVRPDLIDVQTVTGGVDLLVPSGPYDLDLETTTGSVAVVGVLPDTASDQRIAVSTGTGSISVLGYSPPSLPTCSASDGDAYDVLEVTIDGDTLTAELEYSGGCATHDFELCWPDGAFLESDPVQAHLELLHDDHDDSCDGIVVDTRTFDLLPLRQAWVDAYGQASGTIVVGLGGESITWAF